MKFLNLIWVNIKKILKNRSNLLFLILVPIGTLGFTWFVNNAEEPAGNTRRTRLVYESQAGEPGPFLQRIIDAAEIEHVTQGGLEEAMAELRHYRLLSVIEVPQDVEAVLAAGQKPSLNLYKVDEGNVTFAQEQAIEAEINAILREVRLSPYTTDRDLLDADLVETVMATPDNTAALDELMPILMMMFFMGMVMGPISEFMSKLKKNRIFQRLLSTANSSWTIMGSMFLAFVIVQMLFFSLGFMALVALYDFTSMNIPLAMFYLILMGILNIALSLLVTRWVRNETLVSTASFIFPAVFFFVYMIGMMPIASETVRRLFANLNLFNPFYWAASGMENGVLFPNIPVLLLIILIVFTAGSLRLRSYAMDS